MHFETLPMRFNESEMRCKSILKSIFKTLSMRWQTLANAFNVQHNVACKQSPISCVDNVLSFVTTGRHVVLCFPRFVQHLDQTLENVVNALRNIFHPFLFSLNIFNAFTMKQITLQMR